LTLVEWKRSLKEYFLIFDLSKSTVLEWKRSLGE
jgi:hypothetical protein